jgi:DNA-binding winged helix-turn-helix (wHTH) protein/tetratricopeptide (TPR) repeat protein
LDSKLGFGDFVIDAADERVTGPNGPLKLGNKAFNVLLALVRENGRLVTKDVLFSSVWDGTIVSESSLTSVIKELRRALGDESRTPRYIESVYGRGYRFVAPVSSVDGAAPCPPRTSKPGAADLPGAIGNSPPLGPPLVLVSSFHDEAVRHHHPYCADQLREEVLSGLARIGEIQLVADDRGDGASSGIGLARAYQLTARLLPDGSGVKVVARAKRLADGVVVWAETMSLADAGTAGGVEKIVRRIVGATLPAVDEDILAGLSVESAHLYDRYLVAKRRSFTAKDVSDARSAAEMLEGIIAERPDFGPAYPPLVRLYNTDFGYTAFGSTGPSERAHALKLMKNGLAADRSNAHAHIVLGFCYLWHGERSLALKCIGQALALNPYNHARVQEAATLKTYLGDLKGAEELMELAAELNPNGDDGFYEDSGRLHLLAGRHEEARSALEEVANGLIWSDLYLSACELAIGVDGGLERLSRWHQRVAANWHSDKAPSREDLSEWIRRHHPVPDELAGNFIKPIESGLAKLDLQG